MIVSKTVSYPQNDEQPLPHVRELQPNRVSNLQGIELISSYHNQGPTCGGLKVKIIGENFPNYPSLLCKFGDTNVAATFINDYTLECICPPHSFGTVAVEVSHDGLHFTRYF